MGCVVIATLRPLYPRERKAPLTVQDNFGAKGPDWKGAANLAPTGILSHDRPTRSELLYRLSYPGRQNLMYRTKICETTPKTDINTKETRNNLNT